MKRKINIKEIFVLIFILAVGAGLRFYNLGERSLWYDEGITKLMVSGKADEFAFINEPANILYYRNFIIPENSASSIDIINSLAKTDTHPPLYFILLNSWGKLFGLTDIALRAMSAFIGCLSIILFYMIASNLFDMRIASISSFLFATGYFQIAYSQEMRMYPLLLFTALLSTYLVLSLRESDDSDIKYYVLLSSFIVSTALGLYTHYQYLFILLFHFILLIYDGLKDKRIRKSAVIAAVSVCLLYLPWIPEMLVQKERANYLATIISAGKTNINIAALYKFFHTLRLLLIPQPHIFQSGKYLMLLSVLFGLIYMLFRERKSGLPVFLWVFCVTIPTLIIAYNSRMGLVFSTPKYFILLIPVLYLSAGLFLGKMKKSLISSGLITVLCVCSFSEGYLQTIKKDNQPETDMKQISKFIENNYKDGDLIVFNSIKGRGDILIFSNYISKPMRVFAINAGTSQDEFLNAIDKGRRIWYVYTYETNKYCGFADKTPFKILSEVSEIKTLTYRGSSSLAFFLKRS